MRKRRLEIRMVKTPRNDTAESSQYDKEIEGKVAHICFTVDRLVGKAGKIALAYVVLTIGREIVIAKINQPK